ncbi:MAG TPA: hypothetical protein VMR81_00715 [Patescibacteria group bacterium]|nr:hypothetical protein [Patescibacteria group bacterium]
MITALVILYLFLFLSPALSQAHAYLDPGNGSYMIQLLFGGALGLIVSVKLFWKQIHHFFSRLFHKKTDDKNEG